MSAVELGLLAQLVLALAAALLALSAPPALRSASAGVVSAAVGATGVVTGVLVLAGGRVGSTCRPPCPSATSGSTRARSVGSSWSSRARWAP